MLALPGSNLGDVQGKTWFCCPLTAYQSWPARRFQAASIVDDPHALCPIVLALEMQAQFVLEIVLDSATVETDAKLRCPFA